MQQHCAVVCLACSCACSYATLMQMQAGRFKVHSTRNIYLHVVFGIMGWRQGGRCVCFLETWRMRVCVVYRRCSCSICVCP
jgi:hypothetical protein